MILKAVRLQNIRSYTQAAIEFPEGSTLLAGDIGTGKSTILLAIEFALFGIKRGQLNGASLLRHGRKEGSVELHFEVNGKEIVVKRGLKRGKEDVQQDTGYVVMDGVKTEGTAVELKSKILELLGYPKELLTKSKDLVYRYTVYTPQEEMKQILLEHKDTRLDILRRVFNVDKYKRIRENASILVKDLRERMKKAEGQLSSLDEKKRQKTAYEQEITGLKERLVALLPELEKQQKAYEEKKKEAEQNEKALKESNELKSRLNVLEAELKNKVALHERSRKEREDAERQRNTLESELGKKGREDMKKIRQQLADKEEAYEKLEREAKALLPQLNAHEFQQTQSKKLIDKISALNKCPFCLQDVDIHHKDHILSTEHENMANARAHALKHRKELDEAEAQLKKLKEEIRMLKEQEGRQQLLAVKEEQLAEKKKAVKQLEEQQQVLKREIGVINQQKLELSQRLIPFKEAEKTYEQSRRDAETLRARTHELALQKNSLDKEGEGLVRLISNLEKELSAMEEVRLKLNGWLQMQNWLEESFLNLMAVMEKHVLLQIYREFNEIFQKWFAVLIEDQNLNVRLDDEFSPVIEQNGFETSLENLSGGERTAVSLAYRLALNKVINDVISDIKTKDLLILDEPTDGFSSEQLDKVRDVLEQLNIRQIILVSHESKIESFVDHVVRVSKDEHVSSVI
ncbi:AAA family ATPase [Candidatus Woesearchaeota archaeon]|nr:AAA family ATPase [Candidatus Woesearchaeota archaeon]